MERKYSTNVSRRAFLGGAGALAFAAACGGTKDEIPKNPAATRTIDAGIKAAPTTPSVALSEASYRALPANSRISLIEQRGLTASSYPEINGFDPYKELTAAVAEAYAQITPTIKTPEQMASAVQFLDIGAYAQKLDERHSTPLTPAEKAKELEQTLEIVLNGGVYINEPAVTTLTGKVKALNPQLVTQLGSKDLGVKIHETVLFHSLSHLNAKEEAFVIEPIGIEVPGTPGRTNFDHLDGFRFVGKDKDGKDKFINGSDEAKTELVGRYTGQKATGQYLSIVGRYLEGANLIAEINQRANIPITEFIQYNNKLPVLTLLDRWGAVKNPSQPDQRAAILSLFTIGLYTDEVIDLPSAKTNINRYLFASHPNPIR